MSREWAEALLGLLAIAVLFILAFIVLPLAQ